MFNTKQTDIELKEHCDRSHFIDLLKRLLQSMEGGREMDVEIKGRSCRIPAEAFEKGNFRVEYEIDKGEYEFELTMKWR